MPVIQRSLAGESETIGIGDINPTVFLVPRTSSRWQFGICGIRPTEVGAFYWTDLAPLFLLR